MTDSRDDLYYKLGEKLAAHLNTSLTPSPRLQANSFKNLGKYVAITVAELDWSLATNDGRTIKRAKRLGVTLSLIEGGLSKKEKA